MTQTCRGKSGTPAHLFLTRASSIGPSLDLSLPTSSLELQSSFFLVGGGVPLRLAGSLGFTSPGALLTKLKEERPIARVHRHPCFPFWDLFSPSSDGSESSILWLHAEEFSDVVGGGAREDPRGQPWCLS